MIFVIIIMEFIFNRLYEIITQNQTIYLAYIQNMELPQWKGGQPQRFSGGRKHLKPEQQLDSRLNPKPSALSNQGIRILHRAQTEQYVHKPHLKIFPNSYQKSEKQIDLRGKKYIGMSQRPERKRGERLHIPGNMQTIDQVKLRGVRPFSQSNKITNNYYQVQNQMQRKIRNNQLYKQRNHITVTTLGDKPYKYPEYSHDFYKAGGLIAGSTIKPRDKNVGLQKKLGPIFTKPNWSEKVKMQEIQEEKKAINSVDEWEQTILKEANPNWNDPDTFFQRMEAAKNQKDVKKPGKK